MNLNRKFCSIVFIFMLVISTLSNFNVAKADGSEETIVGQNTGLVGDDKVTSINIPFSFNFFGTPYNSVNVSTNGGLTFGAIPPNANKWFLPTSMVPNYIAPFWEDLITQKQSIYYQTVGTAPYRKFIIQWTNMYSFNNQKLQIGTFQTIFYEGTNKIRIQYRALAGGDEASGSSATVGLKNDDGTTVDYSVNETKLREKLSILFTPNGDSTKYLVDDAVPFEPIYLTDPALPFIPQITSSGVQDNASTSPDSVMLAWNSNQATSYKVIISKDSLFSSLVVNPAPVVTSPSYILTKLDNNTTYYWRIEAINSDGSTLSNTWKFNTRLGSDASLSSLVLSGITTVTSDTYNYTATVSNDVYRTTVTASTHDPNASVTLTVYDPRNTTVTDHVYLPNGIPSNEINLGVGTTTIYLHVTAQDHSQASYTITVNRDASSNVELSGLVINQGALAPTLDPGTSTYTVDVPYGTDSLSVTASVYDPNSKVTINGVSVGSGRASNLISLQVGSNPIQIVVAAQDGVTSKTYTLNVTRHSHSSSSVSSGGGSSSGSVGGQLTVSSPSGTATTESNSPAAITKMLGSVVSLAATVLTTDGTSIPDITISPDGQFKVGSNVTPGQYPVVINVIAPNGQVLAGQKGQLTVNSNGTASMTTNLIDPYGVITDSVAKQPISGVNVQLYWADTELNRSKGRTPGTLVTLPELPDFAPNQNHDPQISTTDGRYGWMVFPDGDYYVIAQMDGYQTYDSRKDTRDEQQGDTSYIRNGLIHVGKTIVELSFNMTNNNATISSVGGYVKGYPDGTFHPDSPITRAELASILSRVLPLTSVENKKDYLDVASTHWAMQSIQEMTSNQVMGGYPDITFHPDSPITRAEMASIVARVKHLETKQSTFSDTTNHWASASIGAAQAAGFMAGYSDATFHPDQSLTRAETVTIVNRLMGMIDSQHTSQVTWKDVPSSYWAYEQIQNASR